MKSATWALMGALALFAARADAQRHPRGPAPAPREPAPSATADEDDQPAPRTEPVIAPPADPLALSPEVRERIGSSWLGPPPAPEGPIHGVHWFPYYEERRGDYRARALPPLWLEHTRGLRDPTQNLYGVPKTEDTEGLYGLVYYRRRSLALDLDLVFPAFWRVRAGADNVLVAGPVVHREAPHENDNWLAPLVFEGARANGGYFHSPLILTTTQWSPQGAFTIVGPYFRSRSGANITTGVVPFFMAGDNGHVDGTRNTYTLVPPLLYYHAEEEFAGRTLTVTGPVVRESTPKRDIFDVGPLFFHIHGKPETGGIAEEHTTLIPFFHYGYDPDHSLFILPGYYRRIAPGSDTLLSLVYSHTETRHGSTSLTAVGPVLPLYWNYSDRDLGLKAWAALPFFYTSNSPVVHDWLTPLVGHFERVSESHTWWVFPTLTVASDTHGGEVDFHPFVYVGHSNDTSHTVVAPVLWDFASPKGRTTIGLPVYWRFADSSDDSVTQVAGNTLYMQKRVAGGIDWQFHFLPIFSYGEDPGGYFWNFLFGLVGYSHHRSSDEVRALWIPIDIGGPQAAAAARAGPAQPHPF